ncbi:hypothetical protein [Desulfitobacterium sp.]|uniref:hypothetical protein n=1 Tax=Desulfitobacterium sp. TaxID=49981 RepID=UPI002B1F1545|nr:hypothetical protein [Desulfitobacterium sp.]MEA4900869.1 hypothetical protein [Desulfitobacterium sp.]
MLDYYSYLFKITWPEFVLTSLVIIFILARLVAKVIQDLKRYKKWGRLLLIFKIGFWMGIIAAYLLMFGQANPDWFAHPKEIQGELIGKSLTHSQENPYSLQIQEETHSLSLFVDYRTYKTLEVGDQISLKALPNRMEVYQCEVLPNN